MSNLARRFYVSGRVQGVYFRASARAKAQELGISGYAQNLPDGRVEVLGIGSAAALDALAAWLWQGPPAAHVKDVASASVDPDAVSEHRSGFASR